MQRKYRIKKEPKLPNSEAIAGYFLDSLYEGGEVFDSYPEYYCDTLNNQSSEFIYSIEEFNGERKKAAPIRSGNNATANQGRAQPNLNAGSRAL